MIARCENKDHPSYPRYGGRGISVCEEWHTLENFIAFNDVTKDQAVQWLENALSTENLNAFKNRLATNASIQVRKTFED